MTNLSHHAETDPVIESMSASANLSPLETEVINLFVHLARLLNCPKSVAEIYGLLFIAARPLATEEIIDRLSLSKGSASQGLKFLRGLGAVRLIYVAGRRSDHYEPELELRKLVGGFLKTKLEPQFETEDDRLTRIESFISQLPSSERERFSARLEKLRSWQMSGKRFLPLIRKFLG